MTDNQLTESWDKVFQASQQAIDWVNDVRPNVARLNNEADGLILELRRLRLQYFPVSQMTQSHSGYLLSVFLF